LTKLLQASFYQRSPELVAHDLLGHRLIRRLPNFTLEGIIVETEAYFGNKDPASRAYHGQKHYNQLMWEQPGTVFIYNVHKYWMLNVVAHEPRHVGAVLIRAIEPLTGIWFMRQQRKMEKKEQLTNGPGKLTMALNIDKQLNGSSVTLQTSEIVIQHEKSAFLSISRSHRVGVTRDLETQLRFYIANSRYVSRKKLPQ
jgi:DNA-3-methyladenine glycosylase